MIINKAALDEYESHFRTNLINSLAGVKQAILIATVSKSGQTNLAIFNSLIHIGANPPLWGFVARPQINNRHTVQHILDTGNYTINFPNAADFLKAHQTSARYADNQCEFDACGFTKEYCNEFEVPFVSEAPVKVAMKFLEKVDIVANGTSLIIGSLEFLVVNNEHLATDGFFSHHAANTLAVVGLDSYYTIQPIQRLSYAKTDKWSEVIQ